MPPHRAAFRVRVYEAGPGGVAGPPVVANYLQQSAAEHADMLNVGAAPMAAEGLAWILTRLRLRMERWPLLGEAVALETWPASLDKRFALRAWRLHDAEAAPLGVAVAHWAVFDFARRRLAPLPAWLVERVQPGAPPPLGLAAHGLASPPGEAPSVRLTPRKAELDVNAHVNNAHLLGWLLEPLALEPERRLVELDAAFRSEVRVGDTVESRAAAEPGGLWRHAIARAGTPGDLVRAVTRWA